ncbi:MAG: hypothetical protein BWY67_01613 [Bacteroidetes bacterium ADurb.Bin397]|nr:MAG: hypothetical protein BWY67_01613 [Bacteroidetes bacterium ADurb.Bin397]
MKPYTYIIYPHVRPEVLWAESIEEAVKKVEALMPADGYAEICPFGTTDKVEVGKRAVNRTEIPFDCRNPE